MSEITKTYDLSNIPVKPKFQKLLEEAIDRKCLSDAIKAVAIMESGSLLNYFTCKSLEIGYDFFSKRGERSDLLAEIDIYDAAVERKFPDLKKAGINKVNFFKAKRKVSIIRNRLLKKGLAVDEHSENDEDLIICLFKAIGDDLMDFTYRGAYDGIDRFDALYVSDLSLGTGAEFCVGLKNTFLTRRGDVKRTCLFRTPVSLKMILEYGDPVKIKHHYHFNNYNLSDQSIWVTDDISYAGHPIDYDVREYKKGDPQYKEMIARYKKEIAYRIEFENNMNHVFTISSDRVYSANSTSPNPDMVKLLEDAGFTVSEDATE